MWDSTSCVSLQFAMMKHTSYLSFDDHYMTMVTVMYCSDIYLICNLYHQNGALNMQQQQQYQ